MENTMKKAEANSYKNQTLKWTIYFYCIGS